MNYQKLDGALLAALDSGGDRYTVLVRTKPHLTDAGRAILRDCGAREDPAQSTVFSLDLDRTQLDSLSDQDWVLSIRSTRRLRPLT